jgi:hypothetical protein
MAVEEVTVTLEMRALLGEHICREKDLLEQGDAAEAARCLVEAYEALDGWLPA